MTATGKSAKPRKTCSPNNGRRVGESGTFELGQDCSHPDAAVVSSEKSDRSLCLRAVSNGGAVFVGEESAGR